MAMGRRITMRDQARKGQLRVVELIIAVAMVVTIMLLVMFFARPMRSVYIREVSDLRRLAYNLLNNFAEAGVFERIIDSALRGDAGWEGRMRMLVFSSLPPGIIFRMQVYRVRVVSGTVQLERLDKGGIANVEAEVELKEGEAVHYTYVCTQDPDRMRGEILYVVLVIGYAG